MKKWFSLLAACAGALLLAAPANASILYGADSSLYQIDQTDGSHVVIDSGNGAYRLGLAYNSLTGVMYSVGGFDGILSTVDLTTGNTTAVGPSNGTSMTGLTFSGDFSTLYAFNGNGGPLLAIDPTDGSATTIGATGFGGLDLATDSNGVVYAGGFGGIATIDLLTGAATAIGGTLQWTAIAFDESDVLYGIEISSDALYTIDTATGAATLVGGDIGGDVRGMAFAFDAAAVPAPATLVLVALGIAALRLGKRHS